MSKKYEEYIVKVKKEFVEDFQIFEENLKVNESIVFLMIRKRKVEEFFIVVKFFKGRKFKN